MHGEFFGDGGKVSGEVGKVKGELRGIKLDAHEKEAGFGVTMLIGVDDVPVVAEDEVGDGGHQAPAVRTRN